MTRSVTRSAQALLALALLAGVTPARAQDRPFKGGGSGGIGPIRPGGSLALFTTGSEATHLGKFTLRADVYSDGLDYDLDAAYMEAADGDRVYVTLVLDDQTWPPAGLVTGALYVTGGTSRFAGAAGGADVLFLFTATDFGATFDILFDGTIDY